MIKMNNMINYGIIIKRIKDKSYVLYNGTYHIPHPSDPSLKENEKDYWREKWEDVNSYAEAHPEKVTEEQPYVPPVPTTEELAASVRVKRDRRIAETDYLVIPDYPISQDKLEEIKVYRQALRDLPQQPGFPWNGPDDPACPWPVEP
jgi:hypothetical protein